MAFLPLENKKIDCGIIVGHNCKNITLEDIVVKGALHSDGAVHVKGTSGNTCSNNVSIKCIK